MPNPFVHSMLKASPKYTQFPVSSLGSSKERAQMGVITQESPTTKSTKESCTQPHIKAMLRAQCREWILTLLLLLTGGQRTTCTQHRGTGTGKKSGCYVSSQSCSKPDQTQDDSDLQLWYSARARKYSLYSYLDTSGVEEEGAVHSKTTAAERSQESRVQPSFRVLCCKKTKPNQQPKTQTKQQHNKT